MLPKVLDDDSNNRDSAIWGLLGAIPRSRIKAFVTQVSAEIGLINLQTARPWYANRTSVSGEGVLLSLPRSVSCVLQLPASTRLTPSPTVLLKAHFLSLQQQLQVRDNSFILFVDKSGVVDATFVAFRREEPPFRLR